MVKPMRTMGSILLLTVISVGSAFAQISTINGVKIYQHEYNDDPTAVSTVVNNYPALISFDEESVDNDGVPKFAVRNVWRFSDDRGGSNYQFSNDDFFDVSMTINLTATAISPRKEAGYLFDTAGGQGQFIVNTDGHEVVVFGGPFPFYAFPRTFQAGDTITLGMTYFMDTDGKRKIIYHANSVSSPALTFTNTEQGIIGGTTLGGYQQVVIDPTNPNNGSKATFTNISIKPLPATSNTVNGVITFQGISSTAPDQNVTFIFRPIDGTASFTRNAIVPASGVFSLPFVPDGNYNVYIKGDKYLAQVVTYNTASVPPAGLLSTQIAGDADNNNVVDIGDFGILVNAYNSDVTVANSGYDARADFNGDGVVDIGDFGILVNNYNAVGAM